MRGLVHAREIARAAKGRQVIAHPASKERFLKIINAWRNARLDTMGMRGRENARNA